MSELSSHRLPRTVIPASYHLVLEPDLEAATFSGSAHIQAEVVETTSRIVVNAADLDIASATAVTSDGTSHALRFGLDSSTERLTLEADAPFEPGPVTLDIAFDGTLGDKLVGFYRSTFTDEDGNEHTIATTQFESTNARRAFPCWDEPDLKATFDVTLVVRDGLSAISCAPEVSREPTGDGRVRIRFGRTITMSTYLLAFVVGPLESTEPVDVDGVPVRVVYRAGMERLTRFAIDVGRFSLRHFTAYFGLPYPAEKLDLVALPDFAAGAMENLGCVTFREALLLVDPEATTKPEQQRIADVIAHEVAHMWFGDLVTMRWWNGIWLKEAFATFCEMHATDAMRPDWHRWDDFAFSRSAALDVDALAATRPIEYEVVSPADAEAMYDVLTYEKGAAVVRMLEQFLGADPFREGIQRYLGEHAYGNTETHDLWDALEQATDQPARQIMDSWIFQGGYPLISIERSSPTSLRVRQQRFRYTSDAGDGHWSVPLLLAVGHHGERVRHRLLLDGPETVIDLGPEPIEWVHGNADGSGFYRVALSDELERDLLHALSRLSTVERYGIVDDAWAATVAGAIDPGRLSTIVQTVAEREEDTPVWKRLVAVVRRIDELLDGAARARHRDASLTLLAGALERLGMTARAGLDAEQLELRAALFETAGILGDRAHIAAARELIEAGADPDHTAAAIRIVAEVGDGDDFDRFVQRYDDDITPQEQRRYLFALPRFRGEPEIDRLLEMLDRRQIRSQDGAFVLGRGLANDAASAAVWSYIETNWDPILARYPTSSIPRMVEGAQSVADPEVAGRIDAFFSTHEVPQAGKSLDQHLERMRVGVAFRRRLRDHMDGPDGAGTPSASPDHER